MKRNQLYALAIVAALVPAALGLWGNASFSQNIPVQVPARAKTTPPTSRGRASRRRTPRSPSRSAG